MADIKLGDRVKVLRKGASGKVAFIGNTHFSSGILFGIILDEAKGKHDGTVDRYRYFNCPKNHGIFVRVCQIEKENLNNSVESKQDDILSSKSRYPNYLKASTKLKLDKQKIEQERNDISNTNSQLKNQTAEAELSQNISENLKLREIKENEYSKKLKSDEESVSLLDHIKALEEIKNLKKELDCKKKQIKMQKCHLEVLKVRQCNHFMKSDSYNAAKNSSDQSTTNTCLAVQSNSIDNELNRSDQESNFEIMKALASKQRLIELEEQNKKMIQGLVELRKFIKLNCQSKLMNFEIPNAQVQQHQRSKKKNSSFLPGCNSSSITKQSNNSSANIGLASELKDMLQKMRKFSEIVKEKNKLKKESKSQNLRLEQAGDSNPVEKESITDYNEIFDIGNQQSYCPAISNNKKRSEDVSGAQKESKALQHSVNTNGRIIPGFIQVNDNPNPIHPFKNIPVSSRDSRRHCKGNNKLSPKPADGLKQLVSSQETNSKDPSFAPLIRQDLRMDIPNSASNSNARKSESRPKSPLSLRSRAKEVDVKSYGDGALSIPKEKRAKRRMFSSTPTCQKQYSGNN